MLQQTTVPAVIPRYGQWIEQFPDVQTLAAANEQKVLKAWQGLGYYNRARNLHKSARLICQQWQGRLPSDPLLLRSLPGFGDYTVAAVCSIAFGLRVPLLDANVRRVGMRILNLRGTSSRAHDRAVLEFLGKNLPRRSVGDFNQALMELGALVCRKSNPLCLRCPLKDFCQSFRCGIQEMIPETKKRSIKKISAAVAVIHQQKKKFFIQQRKGKRLLEGLWEFPGGKIEPGESDHDALRREVREELGVEIAHAERMMTVDHFYTEFHVTLSVWWCTLKEMPETGDHRKWVARRDLIKFPMPSGSAKIVGRILKES